MTQRWHPRLLSVECWCERCEMGFLIPEGARTDCPMCRSYRRVQVMRRQVRSQESHPRAYQDSLGMWWLDVTPQEMVERREAIRKASKLHERITQVHEGDLAV